MISPTSVRPYGSFEQAGVNGGEAKSGFEAHVRRRVNDASESLSNWPCGRTVHSKYLGCLVLLSAHPGGFTVHMAELFEMTPPDNLSTPLRALRRRLLIT